MKKTKKIALVTCASNFERYYNIVHAVRRKVASMKGYSLYVLSSYGVFMDGMDFSHGEAAVYSLLDKMDIDGCIIESNIGSYELAGRMIATLRERNIPVVTINMHFDDIPSLNIQVDTAMSEMLEHLITKHKCRKINLTLHAGNSIVSKGAFEAYKKVLKKHRIPFEEKRVVTVPVSIPEGKALFDTFEEAGVMRDCDAVLCAHDVTAIGLTLALAEKGYDVPGDIRICSLNHSGNSIAFRPSITGIDRRDRDVAQMACDMLDKLINGEEVPLETSYKGIVEYHRSCGCLENDVDHEREQEDSYTDVYRRMVYNKIESGGQIGGMMKLNNMLEVTDTFEQLTDSIHSMMLSIGCRSFFFCLNSGDIPYIESNLPDPKAKDDAPYDDKMVVVTGHSRGKGNLKGITFDLRDELPFTPKEGDMALILPIRYMQRDYGFVVFLNDNLPVDVYNYRICHESIGSSIENLHRHIILKSTVSELDRMHMQDQMTGLYNRFALSRYSREFVSDGVYSIALLDMDGLKTINDLYGHLAGNNALCIAADALKEAFGEENLVIRYGGDEFLIVSREITGATWEKRRAKLNNVLEKTCRVQKLPYTVGLSLGYCASTADNRLPLEACIEAADKAMYEDKKQRKSLRK
jgi:diguanylate cyclase (GGDEF)-like protein